MYKNKFLFFFFLIGYFMFFLFVELIFNNINYVYILLRSFCVFLLKICKKKLVYLIWVFLNILIDKKLGIMLIDI